MKLRRGIFAVAALVGVLLLSSGVAPGLGVKAAWAASPVIGQAQKLYDGGKFGEAVAQLRDSLKAGRVTGDDVIAARALLARCLVKAGNRLEGRRAFADVLKLDPNWRPDAVMVPPDEMDVFKLALGSFADEQEQARKRQPASIEATLGLLSGGRGAVRALLNDHGGNKLEKGTEFGGSVRFPISSRWSLDIAVYNFSDKGTLIYTAEDDTFELKTPALAVVGSFVYSLRSTPKTRINAIAGAGPLADAELNAVLHRNNLTSVQLGDKRTGMYVHGGLEGEYQFHPRFAFDACLDYRKANSGRMDFGLFGQQQLFDLNNRSVDFSGWSVQLGLRAYVGY